MRLLGCCPRRKTRENYTQCDSMLIGNRCGAHTFPYIEVQNSTATLEHEASTSKIGEDQIFYCKQRGVSAEHAVSMIVSGFCREVFKELPMEFAVEAQQLLDHVKARSVRSLRGVGDQLTAPLLAIRIEPRCPLRGKARSLVHARMPSRELIAPLPPSSMRRAFKSVREQLGWPRGGPKTQVNPARPIGRSSSFVYAVQKTFKHCFVLEINDRHADRRQGNIRASSRAALVKFSRHGLNGAARARSRRCGRHRRTGDSGTAQAFTPGRISSKWMPKCAPRTGSFSRSSIRSRFPEFPSPTSCARRTTKYGRRTARKKSTRSSSSTS